MFYRFNKALEFLLTGPEKKRKKLRNCLRAEFRRIVPKFEHEPLFQIGLEILDIASQD